jgi:hypothetical protein
LLAQTKAQPQGFLQKLRAWLRWNCDLRHVLMKEKFESTSSRQQ